jgi:YaiO family outer membrane protein
MICRVFQNVTLVLVLSLVSVLGANAQQSTASADAPQPSPQQPSGPVPEKLLTDFVEAGASYQGLSNHFGRWSGGYARGVVAIGKNTLNAEINGQHEFGDAGVYLAAGDTYNFNSDWYASLTLGTSAGGFFWPRFRTDAFLNRKWSERKQFITTLGFGHYSAKDVHRDNSFFIGGTYYSQKPWIIEGGARFNISNPGAVFSPSGFLAVTQGRNKHHYVTLNIGFGEEAYQLIGPTAVLTRFASQTSTLTWRQWVSKNWGFNLVADYYHSPFYRRGGASLGFFREF